MLTLSGPQVHRLRRIGCTGCTLCELDCPYDAIHIWRQDDERAKVLNEHNKTLWTPPKKEAA